MAPVTFERVGKVYEDGTRALRDFDLAIADGEFMVLVGPSGCGKTTALRMVAGPGRYLLGDAAHRRPASQQCQSEGPGHRDGVAELRALPAPERGRQHRLLAQAEKLPKKEINAKVKAATMSWRIPRWPPTRAATLSSDCGPSTCPPRPTAGPGRRWSLTSIWSRRSALN
jgi:ABC-type uncharacterized transport system ATPase subunit